MNKKIKRLLAMMLTMVMIMSSMVTFAQDSSAVPEAAAITMGNKPADGTTSGQPFKAGTGESQNFRIPALVTLSDGTLVAAADARWNTTEDGYGLDTIVSRSSDNGASWNYTFANYLGDNGNEKILDSTAFIDPALAVAKDDTIYMLVDLYPHGGYINKITNGTGYDAQGHLKLSQNGNFNYHLGDFVNGKAQIIKNDGTVVSGYTVDEHFNIQGSNVNTNLFFSDSPFQVVKTSYLYLTKSTDGGKNWSAPQMLNAQVKKDNETFYGVGPGRGLVTSNGTILFPCYRYSRSKVGTVTEYTSVIYSDNQGQTWKRSNDMSGVSSEASIVEADGKLYMFTRHGGYYVSTDDGKTWGIKQNVSGISYDTGCQLSAITYSKKIDGKTAILLSAPGKSRRQNGKIFVGLVGTNGIEWKYTYSVNNGAYSYSCLTELKDGSIGLLYEPSSGAITYKKFAMSTIAPKAQIGEPITKPEPPVVPQPPVETVKPEFVDPQTNAAVTEVVFDNAQATAKTINVTNLGQGEAITAVSDTPSVVTANVSGNQITLKPVGAGTAKITVTVVAATRTIGATSELTVTVKAANTTESMLPGVTVVTKPDSVTYELDVDGIDTGAEYLIVSGTNALTNVGGETSTGATTVGVSGNFATVNGADTHLLWTFTGSGDQYTIQNANAYVRLEETGSWIKTIKVVDTPQTTATVANIGNGNYTIKTAISNKYLVWDKDWLGNWRFYGDNNPQNLNLYKKVTTKAGNYYKTDDSKLVAQRNEKAALDANKDLYTVDSWTALEQAVAAASSLKSQEYATVAEANVAQQKIDAATQKIADAIKNLKKKPVDINVVVGQTVTQTVSGELNATGLDTKIATVSVAGTTMTVKGVAEGKTSVVVGDTTYNITVTKVPPVLDVHTTPLVVGPHHSNDCNNSNNVSTNKTPQGVGKPLTKLVLSDTLTFNVDLKTEYANATVSWRMEDETIATVTQQGVVTGQSVGNTNLIVTIDNLEYKIPVEIRYGVASTRAAVKHYDFYIENINHTTVYMAILHNQNPIKLEEIREGEVIYLEFNQTENTAVDFFGKPDDGYALTRMSAPRSKGDYMSITNNTDPTKTEFYTKSSAAGHFQKGTFDIVNLIKDAVKLGCHAGMGFTRTTDKKCCPFTLSFQSEKLPTVAKEVVSIDGKPYQEGMIAQVGQKVIFKVSVTQYAPEDKSQDPNGGHAGDITYTYVTLTDNLAGATFTSTGKSTLTVKDLSNAIVQQDTTHDYLVEYTIKESDLDSKIVNTVDLSYKYSSNYSTGTYGGTASANAQFTVATFKPDDIVVDFGLPVVLDFSQHHGTADLKSGTSANGAKITVDDHTNRVTYEATKVLKAFDTVTLTNNKGGEYTFKVYPATSVYYEENFATYKGDATTQTPTTTPTQAVDYVGDKASPLYGYDAAYDPANSHSNNTVATLKPTASNRGMAEIDFNGTGIDAYTLTTPNSGKLSKWLYKWSDTNSKYELIKYGYVDTHQDYLKNVKGNFYNTPTVTYDHLPVGNYKLVVRAESGEAIQFDGFKVYNTQGTAYDVPVYKHDMEDGATNIEVRDVVIASATYNVDELTPNKHQVAGQIVESVYNKTNNGSGAILLDSTGTTLDVQAATELVNAGPKNEMYLAQGQAIAMKLTGTVSKVAVGMRSLNGGEVTYSINGQAKTLNSTVDMYHDVELRQDGVLVIANTGTSPLALTKIKATQFVPDTPGQTFAANVTADEDTVAFALKCMAGEVKYADATANIQLVDYAGNAVATTALTANGMEGTEKVIAKADIKAAAEKVLPAGYAFVEDAQFADATVVCGQSKDVNVQVGKVATLKITYKSLFGKVAGTATLTAVQTSANKMHKFSAAEIEKAAPSGFFTKTLIPKKVKYGSTGKRTVIGF